MDFFKQFFKEKVGASFKKQLKNVLGFSPDNSSLYKTALTHRSVRESADENNERLEYLGDASSVHWLPTIFLCVIHIRKKGF